MDQGRLTGMRVAILATDGFEQSELIEPRKALDEAGAATEVVSPKDGRVRGWNHKEWGREVEVDQPAFQFGQRRAVIPSKAGVDGEVGANTPVVADVEVRKRLAKVLIGVAVSERTGIRDAEEEVGEV